MGGDLKTSEKRRHKQPFRVYHFRGHGGDLGTWGGLRNFRAGRIMLLRNINNHLGFTILGDMGGNWGHGGDLETSEKRRQKQPFRV